MSFEKLKNMQDLPVGVHQGLLWLLEQDDSLKHSLARDILAGTDDTQIKLDLAEIVSEEEILTFGKRVGDFISSHNIFKCEGITIVPSSIIVKMEGQSFSTGSDKIKCTISWEVIAGSIRTKLVHTYYDTSQMNTLGKVASDMVGYTERSLRNILIPKWTKENTLTRALNPETIKEIEQFRELYEQKYVEEDGFVLHWIFDTFVVQRQGESLFKSNKNSKIYKRFELAMNLANA